MSQFQNVNTTAFGAPPTPSTYLDTTSTPDPTLDSCCQREEIALDKKSRALAQVQKNDHILSKQRALHRVENELKGGFFSNEICGCCTVEDEYEQLTLLKESLPVNEEEAMMSRVIEDSDSVGSDESDEFDYLLEEEDSSSLTRKSEMLAEAALHEKIGRHGFGRFLNVRDLKKFKFEGVSLIHVYTNNIESARMDVHLETFCGKWKGTRFLRIRKGRMDKFKKWDIVGLVFVKNGEVVTGSQYVDFKSGQSVEGWLEGVGGDKNMNGNVERLCFQEEEEEEEDDTEYYDCGLEGCKKEFYHQHIAPGGAQVVNGLEDLRV